MKYQLKKSLVGAGFTLDPKILGHFEKISDRNLRRLQTEILDLCAKS